MKPTKEQTRIITSELARVNVIACAGSGKTTTLHKRIEYLVDAVFVPPERILVLSFGNDAVDHVTRSLAKHASPDTSNQITVSTCHAFARGLVGKNRKFLGLKSVPKLLLPKSVLPILLEAVRIVRGELKREHRQTNSRPKHKVMSAEIEWLDDLLLNSLLVFRLSTLLAVARASRKKIAVMMADPAFSQTFDADHVKTVIKIRKEFRRCKAAAKVIDFSDMIPLAIKLFERKNIRGLDFDHVLVDEYQDCTPEQVRFIALLAERIPNIMVFGDELQAIYGFMGATYTRLSSVLDGVKSLPLSRSFRLHQIQANFATSVVVANGAKAADIVGRAGGQKPVIVRLEHFDQQLAAVTRRIVALIKGGVAPSKIAVLGARHAVYAPFSQLLRSKRIGTVVSKQSSDHGHPLRVLKLLALVERAANGKTILRKHVRAAHNEITVDREKLRKETRILNKATKFPTLEGRYKACAAVYLRLRGGVRIDREVRAAVNSWEPMCRAHKFAADMMQKVRDIDFNEKVDMLTIHAAKGREWDYVFIVGATDGLIPYGKTRTEQRRLDSLNLMYVALTRSRERTFIFHSPYADARSRMPYTKLSCVLDHKKVLAGAILRPD